MAVFIGLILLIPFFSWIFKETKPIKKKYTMKDIEANNWALYDKLGISKPIWAYYPTTTKTISMDSEDMLKEYYKTYDDLGIPRPSAEKNDNINISAIQEYKGEGIKKFEFRPQNFNQFIGQKEAKERAKTIMKKVNKGFKSHFLIDGIKGHGKTTFVKLIANQLNAKIIEKIGRQIKENNIIDIINKINLSSDKNVILFVDELDTIDWKILKIFNPILESFEISGKKIKPFIFAGATINKHILLKNNPDTLDRIGTHIKFQKYNSQEIAQILNQYHQQLYSEETVSEEILIAISENCKFNPRTSITLLEEYIVENSIEKVFNNNHIIKQGLTNIDIKILQTLNNSNRAMGANALAMKAGLSQEEYVTEYEPFLVEYDYINRIPSRVITDKGEILLKSIEL